MSDSKRDLIREFLSDIVEDWSDDVSDDANLFSAGLLDSLAIHEMVGFLEDEFGLAFDDGDLAVDNFASVDSMIATVDRKQRS
jgi:acyl carrier protein